MKLSIVVPVYNDADNVMPFYVDLKEKVLDVIDYEYEIVMINDGSKDNSLEEMKKVPLWTPTSGSTVYPVIMGNGPPSFAASHTVQAIAPPINLWICRSHQN